jgi:hypothetical protein
LVRKHLQQLLCKLLELLLSDVHGLIMGRRQSRPDP